MQTLLKWLKDPLHLICSLGSLIPIYFVILFMHSYGQNVPVFDQWRRSIFLAVHLKNDTLTWEEILGTYSGHRVFFNTLTTLFFTYFSDWNTRHEMWINLILALINFALLLYLFWRQFPELLHWVLIPVSGLHFSLVMDFNWTNAFYGQWHFVAMFFLLALIVVVSLPRGLLALSLALLFTICASFSSGNGLVVWIILPVVLFCYDYRRWYYFAWWGITASVIFYLFFQGNRVSSPDGGTFQASYLNPILIIRFLIYYIGAIFAAQQQTYSFLMGLIGITVFAFNLAYVLSRQVMTLKQVAPWLAIVAYSLGTGVLTGIMRLQGREDLLWRALAVRFTTTSSLYWIALIMISLAVVRGQLPGTRQRYEEWLFGWNILAGLVAMTLFLQANGWILQQNMYLYDSPFSWRKDEPHNLERCVLDYPLYRETECLTRQPIRILNTDQVYVLAAYRLSIFHDAPQINVLPETYQPGSPIIINSPARWLNVYIRDYLVQGIKEDVLIHVAPPYESDPIANFARPLQVSFENAAEVGMDIIGEPEQVWYITTPEKMVEDSGIFTLMAEQGYVATAYPIQNERYRLAKFSIYRFQQPPSTLETSLYYGEEKISLQSWQLFTADPILPCTNVRVQSWWSSTSVPAHNYSSTLVLVAPDGRLVTQKDASVGETLLQLWQPEQLYLDERILTIPCDAPAGEYQLTWSFYRQTEQGFEELPAYHPAGDELGTRPVLAEITIQ